MTTGAQCKHYFVKSIVRTEPATADGAFYEIVEAQYCIFCDCEMPQKTRYFIPVPFFTKG